LSADSRKSMPLTAAEWYASVLPPLAGSVTTTT
jgi:hypothetical protein